MAWYVELLGSGKTWAKLPDLSRKNIEIFVQEFQCITMDHFPPFNSGTPEIFRHNEYIAEYYDQYNRHFRSQTTSSKRFYTCFFGKKDELEKHPIFGDCSKKPSYLKSFLLITHSIDLHLRECREEVQEIAENFLSSLAFSWVFGDDSQAENLTFIKLSQSEIIKGVAILHWAFDSFPIDVQDTDFSQLTSMSCYKDRVVLVTKIRQVKNRLLRLCSYPLLFHTLCKKAADFKKLDSTILTNCVEKLSPKFKSPYKKTYLNVLQCVEVYFKFLQINKLEQLGQPLTGKENADPKAPVSLSASLSPVKKFTIFHRKNQPEYIFVEPKSPTYPERNRQEYFSLSSWNVWHEKKFRDYPEYPLKYMLSSQFDFFCAQEIAARSIFQRVAGFESRFPLKASQMCFLYKDPSKRRVSSGGARINAHFIGSFKTSLNNSPSFHDPPAVFFGSFGPSPRTVFPFVVVNVHLDSSNKDLQHIQFEYICKNIVKLPFAIFIVGDFNTDVLSLILSPKMRKLFSNINRECKYCVDVSMPTNFLNDQHFDNIIVIQPNEYPSVSFDSSKVIRRFSPETNPQLSDHFLVNSRFIVWYSRFSNKPIFYFNKLKEFCSSTYTEPSSVQNSY